MADDLENSHGILNYLFEKQNELIIKLREHIASIVSPQQD